jgi:hypothetical protein
MISAVGTKRTSSDVRCLVANGGKRTWRGQPNSVEIDPQQTFSNISRNGYVRFQLIATPMSASETRHLSFAFRRWVSLRSIHPTGSQQRGAGWSRRRLLRCIERWREGQPGPAPCVAVYTA